MDLAPMSARHLARNRSMPAAAIVPVLDYPDVRAAVRWLRRAFGFRVRLRADHRAQLSFAGASVVVREGFHPGTGARPAQSILVRVSGIEQHQERALAAGCRIASPLTAYPYGERQYSAFDPGGHLWTFSETLRDVDPAEWGGLPCGDADEDS